MIKSFHYSELATPRETRLIKLRTTVEDDAQLSCEIVTTSMDNPDPYVALSYTWGNETGRERMAVFSSEDAPVEDAPVILVTPNCAAALRKLRASDLIRGRGVWVDAICINQASKEDKTAQVKMMAEIYDKAAAVAVWLGEKWAPERYENVAASTAWYLNTVCKLPDGKGSTEFLIRRAKHHVVRHALRGTDKKSLRRLLEAPNWKRAWILQETTVPSAVILCQDSKYCPTFGLWSALRHHAPLHTEQYGLQLHIDLAQARKANPKSRPETAEDALRIIRNLLPVGSSDPRDKVYAFRGLLPKTLKGVAVDYTLPTAAVFTSATRRYIEAHSNLEILYEATRNPKKSSELPSWALDWAVKDVDKLMPSNGFALQSACASARSEPSFEFLADGMILRLRGRKIGEVGRHAETFCPAERFTASAESHRGDRLDVDWDEVYRTLSQFILYEDKDEVIYSTVQDKYRAFRRLLLRYAKGDSKLSIALSRFFDPNADVAQSLQRARSAEASAQDIPMHIISALSGGMLFLTTEGRFALAFCALERGDLICVFAGLGIPFIVRPKGSSFTLVGCTYVDNVMDGELWPETEDDLTMWEIV